MAIPTSKSAKSYLTKLFIDNFGSGIILEGEVIPESAEFPSPLELPPPTLFAEITADSVIIHERENSNEK